MNASGGITTKAVLADGSAQRCAELRSAAFPLPEGLAPRPTGGRLASYGFIVVRHHVMSSAARKHAIGFAHVVFRLGHSYVDQPNAQAHEQDHPRHHQAEIPQIALPGYSAGRVWVLSQSMELPSDRKVIFSAAAMVMKRWYRAGLAGSTGQGVVLAIASL